jgi:hypothetical protein
MRRLSRFLVAGTGAVALLGGGLITAGPAHAYGNTAVYQLTVSANCNNRNSPLCGPQGFGYGGFWGWIELDGNSSGGTADVQLTFCSHGGGAAQHGSASDVPWMQETTSAAALSGAGIFPLGVNPGSTATASYLVIPGLGFAFPGTVGHYTLRLAPQVFEQVQVAP